MRELGTLVSQAWLWSIAMVAALLGILWRWHRRLLYPLAWILVGMSLATFLVASSRWWQVSRNLTLPLPAPPDASLAQDVKDRLESYEKRADDLEKLLSLLVGMTAVYGIALGLNAYAQAKESAEKLAKIQEDAQQGAQRIESRFPLLSNMDEGIRAMMDRLTHLFPVIDWSDEKYHALRSEERQEVLYYEKAVAALEPLDLRGIRQEASEIYRGLGSFYGSKYGSERDGWTKGYWPPAPLEDDKERARFYLERSLRHDRTNVKALNDRVFFSLNIDPGKVEEYQKAFDLCRQSLKIDSGQQRARYNLA